MKALQVLDALCTFLPPLCLSCHPRYDPTCRYFFAVLVVEWCRYVRIATIASNTILKQFLGVGQMRRLDRTSAAQSSRSCITRADSHGSVLLGAALRIQVSKMLACRAAQLLRVHRALRRRCTCTRLQCAQHGQMRAAAAGSRLTSPQHAPVHPSDFCLHHQAASGSRPSFMLTPSLLTRHTQGHAQLVV